MDRGIGFGRVFATAPVAGQNVGAGHAERVRATFRSAAWIGSTLMLLLSLLCQVRPGFLIGVFGRDPEVLAVGAGGVARALGPAALRFRPPVSC